MVIQPTARVCPNCGAPLSFPEQAHEVACSYCHAVLAVDQTARKAREDAQKIRRMVVLFVAGIMGLVFITTIGGMAMSFWTQRQVFSTVDATQKRAFREACKARCTGDCHARDPRAKDFSPCIDACQARCDKE